MTTGQIVYSKAGRDSGNAFVVIGIEEDNYVLIADGSKRRIEKAKKKKSKHLIETGFVDEFLKNKLVENIRVSNSDIRRSIASYVQAKAE